MKVLELLKHEYFSINNRRYIGSKAKLLKFISNSINEKRKNNERKICL